MWTLQVVYLRLDTSDVADTVSLVSLRGRDLTDAVEPVDTGHPLLWSKLYLADKLVEVSEKRGKDLLGARRSLVTSGGNDILGEVWVVLASARHCEGCEGNVIGLGNRYASDQVAIDRESGGIERTKRQFPGGLGKLL